METRNLKKGISSNFMKMRSAFIEFLHKFGKTKINKEPKATFFSFLSATHPVTQ